MGREVKMECNNVNERQIWVDVLKFVAILAVFVDHTNGFLYVSPYIAYASFFSVTVFVFLSGVVSYSSNIRYVAMPYGKVTLKRLKKILLPYVVATILYLFYSNTYIMMLGSKVQPSNSENLIFYSKYKLFDLS